MQIKVIAEKEVCALISAVKQNMNLYNHTSHKEGRWLYARGQALHSADPRTIQSLTYLSRAGKESNLKKAPSVISEGSNKV